MGSAGSFYPSALGFIGIHWPAHRDASRRIATHRHIGIVTHRRFRPAALGPWGGFTSPPSATHRHPRTHRRFFQSTRRSHAHKVSPGEAQRDCGQARAPSTKHTKRIDWPKRNLAALGRKSAIFGQFGGSCTRPPIASHRVPSRPIARYRAVVSACHTLELRGRWADKTWTKADKNQFNFATHQCGGSAIPLRGGLCWDPPPVPINGYTAAEPCGPSP